MPEVLTLSGLADAEPDYTTFENKTGLAEDMKFLASMPELCDVTFLVGDTREPVCAVKVCLCTLSESKGIRIKKQSLSDNYRQYWRLVHESSRRCCIKLHRRNARKTHHHEKISCACF